MNCKCCFKCAKRYVDIETGANCHTDCVDYLKFKEESLKVKQRRDIHKEYIGYASRNKIN